jgi:hypothetical protein
MRNIIRFSRVIILAILFTGVSAVAQSRFELATHFTSLNTGPEHAPGLGATLTYNVSRRIGLESTLNFFPGDPRARFGNSGPPPVLGAWRGGNILQGQFGVKVVVLRLKKVELFARVEPGFASFSDVANRASLGPGGAGSQYLNTLGGRQTLAVE